jgi:hypothetical protein
MRTETLRGLVLWGEAAAQYACLLRLRLRGRRGGRPPRAASSRSLSARRSAAGPPPQLGAAARRATRNRSDFPLAIRRFFGGFGLVGGAAPEPTDRGFVVYLPGPGAGSVGPLSPCPVAACGVGVGRLACAAHDSAPKRHEMDRNSIGIFAWASAVLPLWFATGIGCAIQYMSVRM